MVQVNKDRELLEQTRFDDQDIVGSAKSHDLDFDPFAEQDGELEVVAPPKVDQVIEVDAQAVELEPIEE